MKAVSRLSLAVSILLLAGCQKPPESPKVAASAQQPQAAPAAGEVDEAEIQASLVKLGAEDRKLAEGQRFCAVMNGSRLGSMGAPVKIMVKDEPVFLCCKGCSKKALNNPDQTLAKVKELRAKYAPLEEAGHHREEQRRHDHAK